MTLAATRRYAFGASVLLGLAATIVAMALISVLTGDPQQVVTAFNEAELGAFVRLVVDRFIIAARAVVELL